MRFLVSGGSMEPKYFDGDKLFVLKFLSPRVGDAVVLKDPRDGRLILKSVSDIKDGMYFVVGENSSSSTDSRKFGPVGKNAIVGKVVLRYSRR